MAAAVQSVIPREEPMPAFFSIADLAARWRCSRGSVYNWLRGHKVVDFAPRGGKGRKLVSREVVQEIEGKHLRTFR